MKWCISMVSAEQSCRFADNAAFLLTCKSWLLTPNRSRGMSKILPFRSQIMPVPVRLRRVTTVVLSSCASVLAICGGNMRHNQWHFGKHSAELSHYCYIEWWERPAILTHCPGDETTRLTYPCNSVHVKIFAARYWCVRIGPQVRNPLPSFPGSESISILLQNIAWSGMSTG